jgi:hypothetical protein
MTSPRLPSTTAPTSGFQKIQTFYTDENGSISISGGPNEIWKYWDNTAKDVYYRNYIQPLVFLVGETKSWTWNGSELAEYSHSALDTSYASAIKFKDTYFVIKGSNSEVFKSTNLTSWTSTGEYGLDFSTDGTTLALLPTASGAIRYTTDGSSWTTKSTWATSPVAINSIKYLNGKWIAVGYMDDTGGSGYYKPWVAEATSLGGSWTETNLTSDGDGDTSFLDIAYSGGNYYAYAYVGANNDYINVYSSSSLTSWGQYPSYYGSINHTTTMDRRTYTPAFRAIPNNKIAGAFAGYEYLLNGTSLSSMFAGFTPAQDRNGAAYGLITDNTDYFLIDDTGATLVTIPSPYAYVVGGVA